MSVHSLVSNQTMLCNQGRYDPLADDIVLLREHHPNADDKRSHGAKYTVLTTEIEEGASLPLHGGEKS